MSARLLSNTTLYHNTPGKTSAVVHNADVQPPLSPRYLQTGIRLSWCCRQMRDSSVNTTSFPLPPTYFSSHHWRRSCLGFCVKGRPSNGRLADRPLTTLNGVEWYAQALNGALQTQSSVLWFVM
ncbi:hypothetical protein TNCV_515621 [Trichonephila clavipes]|nr:hypothetical protein TNCV_515621 [Trichonephila clavipes]